MPAPARRRSARRNAGSCADSACVHARIERSCQHKISHRSSPPGESRNCARFRFAALNQQSDSPHLSLRRLAWACSASFAHNSIHAHDGVLHVGAGFAFEAQRVLEIERDYGRAREAQQEIAQRADCYGVGDCLARSASGASAWRASTSLRALASRRSSKSSAFTPWPLRPLTST